VAWLPPLDPAAPIRRQTIPLARIGLPPGANRVYEMRVGYLLGPEGEISTFAVGSGDSCISGLLEAAGISRPLGACANDPSVGVDLGGRIVVLHPSWGTLHVSVAEAPPVDDGGHARRGAPPPAVRKHVRSGPVPGAAHLPVALHEVGSTLAQVHGLAVGAGTRAGAPVVVVVDAAGEAVIAAVDPDRGTLGPEERLRPLSEAALGSSPACTLQKRGEVAARVVLPFEGTIAVATGAQGGAGLVPPASRSSAGALPGVGPGAGTGVAVLRWSRERACLDAVEVPVHDDRFDETPGPYDPHGVLRKIVARFDGKGQAALVLVGMGSETRQRLSCTALLPGHGEAP
jgi:hypothetical protein